MKRNYYAVSGTFSNAITIRKFASKKERAEWIADEPMYGVGSHYEHDRQAITRREAFRQLSYNRRMHRDYMRYGAPYDQCYGTTEID